MILCIDIGGTAIKYAGYTCDGTQLQHGVFPTAIHTYEDFLQCIVSLYESLEDVEGIAISLPGLIDTTTGLVITGGALTCNAGHEVVKDLQQRCLVPVSIQNDGKCAALAEVWKGSLAPYQHGIVFVIGTGIGGGIIIDHKLYVGAHAFAGELSYLMNGTPSFETMLGATGSVHSMLSKYQQLCGELLDGKAFFTKVEEEDPFAIEILHSYAKCLAMQFYNLQALYDPEVIAIGGGISAQPSLLKALQEEVDALYQQIPFDIPHATLKCCQFGNDANLMGALYQYRQTYQTS